MEVSYVDLKAQYQEIKSEIDIAIQSVFESGQFIGGDFVNRFESLFAQLLKINSCTGVGNGTDALFIAMKAMKISAGDEVITPAFAWISSAETITLAGAKPIFCDISPGNYTIDTAQIESKITSRTKGVIVVHLYGQAAEAHRIKGLCKKHDLFLIEDCAQAHFTEEHNIPVGTIGDAGTFSFYPTKNLGAYGDAGSIVTNDKALEIRIRQFANHGGLQEHLIEGTNSRMDPMQAAILTVKSRYLASWTAKRIANAALYNNALIGKFDLTLPYVRPETRHSFHQFVVRTPRRDQLRNYLMAMGIQTMVHYPTALPNLPAYRHLHHQPQDFPIASRCQDEVLSLPIHPNLSESQILYVCEQIESFFKTK